MPDDLPPDPLAAVRGRACDPVRLRLAEALARRAPAHDGAARLAVEARLAAVLQELAHAPEQVAPAAVEHTHAIARAAPGALADLVADVARRKPLPLLGADSTPRAAAVAPAAATAAAKPSPAPADGRTLQFFKRTWSRLNAEQRLAQSRASLPGNAGPLNSHHLVHRALTLMQSLSPAYLEHFVGYVDALQWLEQANEAAAADPRAGVPRRSAALRR